MRIMPFKSGKTDHVDKAAADVPARLDRDAFEFEPKLDVVEHGAPRQEPELLEDHRPVGARSGDRLAADAQFARIRFDEPEQNVEESSLAAAGRADYRQELALLDLDIEAVKRPHRPTVRRPEGKIDIAAFDTRWHAA
jgi:hypothetical protein